MESQLSSRALIELAARLATTAAKSLHAPFEVELLFEAARSGDALGRAVVTCAARATVVCIAGLTCVVDLELVLLGGVRINGGELLLP